MHILQVIGGIADVYGGPAKVVREMCRELAARGHTVDLYTTNASFGTHLDVPLGQPVARDGYHVFYYPCPRPRNPHFSPALLRAVYEACVGYDVAHVHGVFNVPSTGAMLALRKRRVPYVVRPAGLLDSFGLSRRRLAKRLYMRAVEKGNLEAAAYVQASTEHERDNIEELRLNARVVVVPQGVAVEDRPRAGSPLDRPYLLFLGRLSAKKGLPLLVHSFTQIAGRVPDLILAIVGPDEGEEGNRIRMIVNSLGLADRVCFPGMARGVDKASWFAHAEAFVLPSKDENFGVAVIEAAGYQTPVIVSEHVGLAPAVANTGAGAVVSLDEAELADAMLRVLTAGRPAYGHACLELAKKFSWTNTTEQLESLYIAMDAGCEVRRAQ